MSTPDRVSVTDVRLDLTSHLTEDERAELARVSLPVATVGAGPLELGVLLTEHSAFGATILDGMVMQALRIAEQTGIQLLGPGDLLLGIGLPAPSWLAETELRVVAPARLALLGNDFLGAVYRWPRVVEGVYASVTEQHRRMTAQLVICQLPRVEQRVLALMWLLAESWGRVTLSGTRLPLNLTHETLGALVGARRPTVSLALRKLNDQGSIIHQAPGWLLLGPPPQPTELGNNRILPPELPAASFGPWASVTMRPSFDPTVAYAELRDTVRILRERHIYDTERTRERLNRVRSTRIQMAGVRKRIAEDALSRRWPPSS